MLHHCLTIGQFRFVFMPTDAMFQMISVVAIIWMLKPFILESRRDLWRFLAKVTVFTFGGFGLHRHR